MAKGVKTHFTCQSCGYVSAKWLGRCTECGTWGSLVEEVELSKAAQTRPAWGASTGQTKPVLLQEVDGTKEARRLTGIAELDRVLGGVVVQGSLVLLGGEERRRTKRETGRAGERRGTREEGKTALVTVFRDAAEGWNRA